MQSTAPERLGEAGGGGGPSRCVWYDLCPSYQPPNGPNGRGYREWREGPPGAPDVTGGPSDAPRTIPTPAGGNPAPPFTQWPTRRARRPGTHAGSHEPFSQPLPSIFFFRPAKVSAHGS